MPQILVNSNFDHTVSGSHGCVNTSLRINLKVAKMLGLTIALEVLYRADRRVRCAAVPGDPIMW
jgi:hypothetical protein